MNISKNLIQVSVLALLITGPAMASAQTPKIESLQQQLNTLMERFETYQATTEAKRDFRNASSTRPGTASTTPRTKTPKITEENRTCMAAAIVTREADLKTLWVSYNTSIEEALDKRAEALAEAWNTTNFRTGVTAAWREWRSEKKELSMTFKEDRKEIWDAFRDTAKAECKTTLPKEESLDKEAAGTISL